MAVKDIVISEFMGTLSSNAPIPGGGGVTALGGALGNALGQMVANLTIGKKKYADVEEEIKEALAKMEVLQQEFLKLADRDEEAFAPLAAAYKLPSGTEEERKKKDAVMEECLLAASLVPLEVMEKSVEMLDILEMLAEKGSRLAISDAGVGVQFIRAALSGAVMNVWINVRSMKNREKAEELKAKAHVMLESGMAKADAVYEMVRKVLE